MARNHPDWTWRERSGFGKLWIFLLIAWTLWSVADIAYVQSKIAKVQADARGNGLAALAITHVAKAKLLSMLIEYLVVAAVLGVLVYLTRGRWVRVERRSAPALLHPSQLAPPAAGRPGSQPDGRWRSRV